MATSRRGETMLRKTAGATPASRASLRIAAVCAVFPSAFAASLTSAMIRPPG
jgi:hypothetical protein